MKNKEAIRDHTLETLLDMVGVYASPDGWWVKTEARRVSATAERPFGVKYSLSLHDRSGKRILGYDNSHGIPDHRRVRWDHKHLRDRIRPYDYRSAAQLLTDFYADVDKWLSNEK